MFFKSKKEEIKYVEHELQYWEDESYLIVPYKGEELTKDIIINNLSRLDSFKIIGYAEPSYNKPGRIVFNYKSKDYEISYLLEDFKFPEPFFYQMKNFTEEEKELLKSCDKQITLFMDIKDNLKDKYQVEIIIGTYILDKIYGILDESAEKAIPPKLAYMLSNSKTVPGADDMYSIQAIVDNDKIWLHTHGLLRYGIPELEILESNIENYNSHYNVISSLADTLINKGVREDNKYFLGCVNDKTPLTVTLIPWFKALKEYDGIDLGGSQDRVVEHNSKYSVIFVYESNEEVEKDNYSKINIFDGLWDEEPVFLFTSEETERMSLLAQEKFYLVKKYFDEQSSNIIIKIGVKTDNDSQEHMWFELLELRDNDTFKVKLISTPYDVSSMKEGDICEYSVNDVTDWIIYINDVGYSPDRSYLIDGE